MGASCNGCNGVDEGILLDLNKDRKKQPNTDSVTNLQIADDNTNTENLFDIDPYSPEFLQKELSFENLK